MAPLISLSRFSGPPPSAPWWIRRAEIIAAPPERVWKALITPSELTSWWCDFAAVTPERTGSFAFGGPHVYGDSAVSLEEAEARPCGILTLDPERELEIQWQLHGVTTRVQFLLENELESTRLRVLQCADRAPGWSPEPGPSWWAVALPALRAHVEKGAPELRVALSARSLQGAVELEVQLTTFPWVIWNKLSSPAELRRWWSPAAEIEPTPGGRFSLSLPGEGPTRVLALEEERRLRHDWTWSDGSASEIEWTLQEEDDAVRVRVVEVARQGQGTLPHAARLLRWASALLDLKRMSERGIAAREIQEESF